MNESPILELQPIQWHLRFLKLIDQRALPAKELYLTLETAQDVADAIRSMVVRGAPAIGITAAYGVVLSFLHRKGDRLKIDRDFEVLAQSRPTAVNLHHALTAMRDVLFQAQEEALHFDDVLALLEAHAIHIHTSDLAFNQRIAKHGLDSLQLLSDGVESLTVLTHCNTGSLATGGLGTALGIIKQGARQGIIHSIYATETRPWLQGSRLTAFELLYEKLNMTLLVDSAAASLMAGGTIHWLIVGADRITSNGDVANKVGTLALAVLARQFGVKVMVAAPKNTIDFSIESGEDIPIEYRGGEELLQAAGYENLEAVSVFNPVFDVTPASYIDLIVTEEGAFKPNRLRR